MIIDTIVESRGMCENRRVLYVHSVSVTVCLDRIIDRISAWMSGLLGIHFLTNNKQKLIHPNERCSCWRLL